MAILRLEFHCLCLFVRDEANDRVYVLMPKTHSPHEHVVMMYNPSFPGGKRIHGLEWVIAGAQRAVVDTLNNTGQDSEIVDLTEVTDRGKGGRKAKSELVSTKHRKVRSRIKLYSGSVRARKHQATWRFRERNINMAYKVVWEVSGVADVQIWNSLDDPDLIPFHSLSDLKEDTAAGTAPAGEKVYTFRIYHTLPEFLPPNDDGDLSGDAVREHFKHFYDTVDHNPKPDELPSLPPPVATVNCGAAQIQTG